jgi:hypothetical protein
MQHTQSHFLPCSLHKPAPQLQQKSAQEFQRVHQFFNTLLISTPNSPRNGVSHSLPPAPSSPGGIADRTTWLNNEYEANPRIARPLPFDQNLQPVEAFNALTAAFARIPPTT